MPPGRQRGVHEHGPGLLRHGDLSAPHRVAPCMERASAVHGNNSVMSVGRSSYIGRPELAHLSLVLVAMLVNPPCSTMEKDAR